MLADFLFGQTGGQPLYLLETLKLLRERELLVPRRGTEGTWWLEPTVDLAAAVAQERSRRELLPPSVRALIQAHTALAPAGDGQCGAGDPGERQASLADGRAG